MSNVKPHIVSNLQRASIALVLLATPWLSGTASTRSYVDGHMSIADIEVYLQMKMAGRTKGEIRSLASLINTLSHDNGFTPATVLALVEIESRFDATAISSAGAIGLMQLKPETARFIARRNSLYYRRASDLMNPRINLNVGVHYLAYLRDRFGTSEDYLAAYNMGPNKFRRMQLVAHSEDAPAMVRRYVKAIQSGVMGFQRNASHTNSVKLSLANEA